MRHDQHPTKSSMKWYAEIVYKGEIPFLMMEDRRRSDEHEKFLEAARAGKTEQVVKLVVRHLEHVESALPFSSKADDARKHPVAALLS